jgi:drug/metabolite transporter (DMT)-like permease
LLALSWIAAVVACLGYGVASILQSVGAQRVSAVHGVGGIVSIMRQLPYLLGLGADGVAFAANVLALQQLPLFLVESIVAGSVGVTAVIAVLRGAHLGWKDWASLAVLGLGLVLLSLTAAEGPARRVPPTWEWVILAAAVVPLATGLVGIRLRGRASAIVLAVSAGLGFSGVAIAARGLQLTLHWSLLLEPLLWAIAVNGVVAVSFFGVALQRGSVTMVTAVTFVIEVLVPSVVGLLVFGDTIARGRTWVAVLGVLLAVAGTISLSRFTPGEPAPADADPEPARAD